MHLSTTKLWRDNNKNFEHLFMGYLIGYIFWVFTLNVRAKHFQVDQDGMKDECTYS
jgi:hypothetical protein